MENFETEFKSVAQNYRKAAETLIRLSEIDDSQYSSLVKSILENRDCFDRIDRMHAQVIHLAGRWKKRRENTDEKQWEQIDRLAEDVLQQAVQLNQLCRSTADKLQSAKERLGVDLAEIGKGTRFLKSASPSRGNYPKFIDSVC